jgi:hypothetical protein
MDNSIWYVAENMILPMYSEEISRKLKELESIIKESFVLLRKEYPRLYLLTDEDMLCLMSSGSKT